MHLQNKFRAVDRISHFTGVSRRRFGEFLSAGLFVGGVLLYFHAFLLTTLGWANGFRFVTRLSSVYLAVGTVLLGVIWYRGSLGVRTAVLTAIASLPLLFGALVSQPSTAIFTPLESALLYGPVTLALPLGVARAVSRNAVVYSLVGVVCVVWGCLAGLVLLSSPRGPIGLFLTWNYAVAVVLAVPLYLIGRATAKPTTR